MSKKNLEDKQNTQQNNNNQIRTKSTAMLNENCEEKASLNSSLSRTNSSKLDLKSSLVTVT